MAAVDIQPVNTRRATTIIVGAFLFLQLLGIASYGWVEQIFIRRTQDDAQAVLRLVSGTIQQAVGRYDPIPALIARDPIFRELLQDPDNEGILPFVNEKLRFAARAVSASDIYIMDRSGLTIAASNYREEQSFVGKRFDYRPYFQRSLSGETARFHALGTTSGERGFFFSAPILEGIEVVGVLAVKFTVDSIEAAWTAPGREILVADPNGVIFLSSRPEYRMRGLTRLPMGTIDRIERSRQFPLQAVTPLSFSASVVGAEGVEVVLGEPGSETRYLSSSVPLALPGWHAIALNPFRPIRARTLLVLAIWGLAVLALSLASFAYIQRRARFVERSRIERSQRATLEAMVRRRTADLAAANAGYREEIKERKAAEELLRRTQKELVQAGKLAALGQMSASLSHEINQPLSAIKSYADNAVQYIERGRHETARENITLISKMIDRVARISAHLRNFARRPGDKLSAVPVGEIIQEAIDLVEPHSRKNGAEIRFEPPDVEHWALGGRLRLQQVVVNVLTNAVDSMAGGDQDKVVEVALETMDDTVRVEVRDYGAGLPEAQKDQLFEPFFTTKETGAGMGLGLSISFNIIEDFGGSLCASNHAEGGAVFEINLKKAAEADAAGLVAE